jgi:hypothetical protein
MIAKGRQNFGPMLATVGQPREAGRRADESWDDIEREVAKNIRQGARESL